MDSFEEKFTVSWALRRRANLFLCKRFERCNFICFHYIRLKVFTIYISIQLNYHLQFLHQWPHLLSLLYFWLYTNNGTKINNDVNTLCTRCTHPTGSRITSSVIIITKRFLYFVVIISAITFVVDSGITHLFIGWPFPCIVGVCAAIPWDSN